MIEKSQYKTLTEFKRGCPSAYNAAKEKGLLQKICDTFGWNNTSKMPDNYWDNKNKILAEALKYNKRSDWAKSSSSYQAAKRLKIFDECVKHMVVTQKNYKEKGLWNIKENVIEEVKKYKGRTEWQNKSHGSYEGAVRNGWLEECLQYLDEIMKPRRYWSKETIINESNKYATIKEWRKKGRYTYKIACENKWLNDCPIYSIKYSKEDCINDAKRFDRKWEWVRHKRKSTVKAAKENGWMDECTAHMIVIRGKYTKERCINDARKFNNKTDWRTKKRKSTYKAAKENGWFEECTTHMVKKGEIKLIY